MPLGFGAPRPVVFALMMPRELVDEPPTVLAVGAPSSETSGGSLRIELLHRHLSARIDTARERLRVLEERNPGVDEVLVVRFGDTVAEAQRTLAAERVDAELRSTAFLRVARERAAKAVSDAEADAGLLRVIAGWLRQVPVGVSRPDTVIDLTDAAVAEHDLPEAVEATAS
jgi:hypothetical protein